MFTGVRCECELSVSKNTHLGASERKQATLLATGKGIRASVSLVWVLASLVDIRRLRFKLIMYVL